uniref:Uncharacterized protein n=1 Tax=Oryza barthii TaxID=65489 RepID=A0A0D3HSG9_9ORYZ
MDVTCSHRTASIANPIPPLISLLHSTRAPPPPLQWRRRRRWRWWAPGGGGGGEAAEGPVAPGAVGDRWGELLTPEPANAAAVALSAALAWAGASLLLQLALISFAIFTAAVKYSFVAALLLFVLIALLFSQTSIGTS